MLGSGRFRVVIAIVAVAMLATPAAVAGLVGGESPREGRGPVGDIEVIVGPQFKDVYDPPVIFVSPGDTVNWTWWTSGHSVTSAGGNETFDSGVQDEASTFTHTFMDDGEFFFYCTQHAGPDDANDDGIADGAMVGKVFVGVEPTAAATPTSGGTASATPPPTPTTGPVTPTIGPVTPTTGPPTPTSTTQPARYDLYEGWNLPVDEWSGPILESARGEIEIGVFFNANVEPLVWEALAVYEPRKGLWEQYFRNPPLPAFQTLGAIYPGEAVWIFVTSDATLTIP
jgi:plastocyanin